MNDENATRIHQVPQNGGASAGPQPVTGESQSALDVLQDGAGNKAVNGLLGSPPAGEPLDEPTRVALATSFGDRFDDVRLHDDPAAHTASNVLAATAFTHGRHIYLGAAAPERESPAGQQLLAHELAHVVQQRGAPPADRPAVNSLGDAHEAAADRAAAAAMNGQVALANAAGPAPAIQRQAATIGPTAIKPAPQQSAVEIAVRAFLEREWAAQSNGEKPLRITKSLRDGLEVVFNNTPMGLSTISSYLQHDPGTVDALMAKIGPRLPSSIPANAASLLGKLPAPKAKAEPKIEGPSPAKGDEAYEAALKEVARRFLETEAGQQLAKSTKKFFLSKDGVPLLAIVAGGAITLVAANDPKLPSIPEIELGDGIKIKIEYSGRATDLPPLVRQMLGRAPTAGALPTPDEYRQLTGQPEPQGPDEVKAGLSVEVSNDALVKFVKAVGEFFVVVGRGIGKGIVAAGKVIGPYLAVAAGGAALGALIGLAVGGGLGAGIGAAIGAGAALLLYGIGKIIDYVRGKNKKGGDE